MKKSLLAVAMLLVSGLMFAQNNVSRNDNNATGDVAISQAKEVLPSLNEFKAKANKSTYAGATLLCDFSEPSTFEFGFMGDHSNQNIGFVYQADTNSNFGSDYQNIMTSGYCLNTGSDTWYYFHGNDANGGTDGRSCMSAYNGFVFVPWIKWGPQQIQNLSGTLGLTNANIHCYVIIKTPVVTYGMSHMEVHINQYMRKFNSDTYYLDWSADPNFADGSYDSVEFNIRGSEVQGNSYAYGDRTIVIPNGTSHCEIIGTSASDVRYFRIRVKSPAVQSNDVHGYFFMFDDISYKQCPATRVENVNSYWWNGAYGIVPPVVVPDTLQFVSVFKNTGTDSLSGQLRVTSVKVEYDDNNNASYTDLENLDGGVTGLGHYRTLYYSTDGYGYESMEELTGDNAQWDHNEMSNLYTVSSRAGRMQNTSGNYMLVNNLLYTNTNTNENFTYGITYPYDSSSYVVPNASDEHLYRWSRDNGLLWSAQYQTGWRGNDFTYGYVNQRTSTEGNHNLAGYKVCVAYDNNNDESAPVYAVGVEVVPSMDNCQGSLRIKGSLMKWNDNAQSLNDENLITVLADDAGNGYVSDNYTVTTADLNSHTDDGMRTISNGQIAYTWNPKTISLPFSNNRRALLEPGEQYYACYELVTNGEFSVGVDGGINYSFGTGSNYNIAITSPNATGTNRAWGGNFMAQSSFDYSAPMVRMIVSDQATGTFGGLTDIDAQAADMNVYPNPAVDNAVLNYTLTQTGNVTIEVSDLMGRTVATMDRGLEHAGVSHKANIDVTSLTSGTYFCTVRVNGVKSTAKLVVNK